MTSAVERVGLLYHPRVEAARHLANELAEVARSHGYEAWIESAWAEDEIIHQADRCELLITLGGDGSILRVARASLGLGRDGRRVTPPLLTVDFGTLGFLTELQPEEAVAGLERVLAGDYWIEERRLLHATLERQDGTVEEREALNEVVLARGDGPHAIRLTLLIDGAEAARYMADGMIIATPTGSTAYALGAGGPIMGPSVEGMLAIPVAPHLAVVRSFVVPPSSRITLRATAWKSTVVAIDGQIHLEYMAGDLLHITQGAAVARFVRTGPKNYFYATLQAKLRLDR